jgi:hypothetical protein
LLQNSVINSWNVWASLVFGFGLAPDTSPCSCAEGPRVHWAWDCRSSIGAVPATSSEQANIVHPPSTWSWSPTFTFRTGTVCRAQTSVQAMCSYLLQEDFRPSSKGSIAVFRWPFAAPSSPSHTTPESPCRCEEWAEMIVSVLPSHQWHLFFAE